MTASLNANCSGAWRSADGLPVTVTAAAGRAVTVELLAPMGRYPARRAVTLPRSWVTVAAPEPEPTTQPPLCPACRRCREYFGPAAIVDPQGEYEYVNCKRCGAMLLVGRDIEL